LLIKLTATLNFYEKIEMQKGIEGIQGECCSFQKTQEHSIKEKNLSSGTEW
jgi:hypothetical protein